MAEYIALLRGINVGKAKRVAMADLRSLLEGLGHTEVRTLLNSGNAIFRARNADTAKIASAIENEIAARMRLAVATIVVTSDELETIIRENPLPQATAEPSRFLVAFVQRPDVLRGARSLLAQSWEPEAIGIGAKAAYLWCDGGLHTSRVAQAFSRATRDAATTRNWATVLKLRTLVSDAAGL